MPKHEVIEKGSVTDCTGSALLDYKIQFHADSRRCNAQILADKYKSALICMD